MSTTPSLHHFWWATDAAINGTASVQDLEKDGWTRGAQHPLFPGCWLMERAGVEDAMRGRRDEPQEEARA